MKRKEPAPDIEAMIDAVVADHIPGRTGLKPAIASLIGKPVLPPTGRVPGEKKIPTPVPAEAEIETVDPEDEASVDLGDSPDEPSSGRHHDPREKKQAAKLRTEKAALKIDLERLKAEKAALKDELNKAIRRRDSAEKGYEAEKGRHEAATHDLFDAWRREAGLDFAHPRQKAAIEKARAGNADAFSLAERALATQAAANAKYGTVRALREEFERIDRLAGEVRFAMNDSLYPVPELGKAAAALEARRRKLLEDPETAALLAPADPGVLWMSLSAIEDLPNGKSALSQLERFGAIAGLLKESALVDDRGHERFLHLLEAKVRRVIRVEASRSAGRAGVREETFETLVRDGGASRFVLLVDGNNLLVTNESVFGDGGVIPDFSGKRARLNQALENISARFAHVFAVYDGTEDREEPHPGNLTVVYTEKKQRTADDWIVSRVAEGKPDGSILATDDAGLIALCPGVHAVIGSRHLYEFLSARGAKGC